MTDEGLRLITNPNLKPIHYKSNLSLQYSQTIAANLPDKQFNFQNVPMPNAVGLFLTKLDYMASEYKNDLTAPVNELMPLNVVRMTAKFGTRDLSSQSNVTNFKVGNPESRYQRMTLLKHSDIFGWAKSNPDYWDDLGSDYAYPHLLFSFNSSEDTKVLLRPIDYNGNPDIRDTLTLNLYGDDSKKLGEGTLFIMLIYSDWGLVWNNRTTNFLTRDIKNMMVNN
jgi:hypothetical protein